MCIRVDDDTKGPPGTTDSAESVDSAGFAFDKTSPAPYRKHITAREPYVSRDSVSSGEEYTVARFNGL